MSIDVHIAKALQRWCGGPTSFWRFFARFGMYGYVATVFAYATVIPLWDALRVLFAPALATFLATAAMQYIIRRERPYETRTSFRQWLLHYSFPSAHAASAACFAVVLSDFFIAVTPAFAALLIGAAWLLALGIALSRIVVGVHYPSDVVAGLVLGSAIGLVFVTV